jgi:hypothetical protein
MMLLTGLLSPGRREARSMSANSFPRSIRLALLDIESAPQIFPAGLKMVLKLYVDLNALSFVWRPSVA